MPAFEPEFKDLLPQKKDAEPNYVVSRPLYSICFFAWVVSLVSIPLCMIFNRQARGYSLASIIVGFILYAVTGFGSFSNIRADKNQRGGFDSVLQAVKISTAALFAASLLISILYGGAPEKVDGEYVIISHNKVIRTLGELEYKLLCINEGAFMSFGACSLFSSVLLYARRHLPKNSENTK